MSSSRAHQSLLVFALLCAFYSHSAAQSAGKRIPTAVVVGTVYCHTCFRHEFSKPGHLLPGALVAVECGGAAATAASFRKEAKTDRNGVFRILLPPKVSKHMDLIRSCSVKLIRSNEPLCAVASSATSAGLRLSAKTKGVYVFSAGLVSFKPLNLPELCHQTPKKREQEQNQPAFFLPIPPIPLLPSPSVGGLPLPPNPLQPPSSVLPPVLPPLLPPLVPPLQPPPSLLPPPSGLLPPLPLQPPSPPAFNLPPLPIVTPPAPPPVGFPLPRLPLPPTPLFPGNPPASASKTTSLETNSTV